jgi:hypothetical protein
MLLTVRGLPADGQRRLMEAVLDKRSLFGRGRVEDTKLVLLDVAHLMDPEVSIEVLGRLAERASGRIRKAAEEALRKVEDAY